MSEQPTKTQLEQKIRELEREKKTFAEKDEERYRTIFEYTGNATILIAEDTTILLANSNFANLAGYTKEEMEGRMSWTGFIVPEDLNIMKEYHVKRRVNSGSAPNSYEFRFRRRTGEIRDILLTVALVPGTKESVASCMDITERKRAMEALRQNEEQYRTIFEHTASANMIIAPDTTVLFVNSNFEKIMGYSREEIENKMSWTRFVAHEDVEAMKQRHTQRRRNPGSVPNTYEFRGRTKSGEIRDFFISVTMIPGSQNSVASLFDVTERKKAEDDLRQSEERFKEMASLLPETVFEADLKGMITFVNEPSLDRFGYTRTDVEAGLNFMDVLMPQDRERARVNFQKIIQGAEVGLNEYLAQKKDGTIFPVLAHSTRFLRNGRPVGTRGFLVDITEKKAMENKLMRAQKLEAIGTLAGGIAHDFNNLLMGILGNLSLLSMQLNESHPFHNRLKSMEEYVQRGSDLTRQLLGFARGGKYEVRTTNLGKFAQKSAEMFGRARKEISIHHKTVGCLWHVDVDRGQMDQVLLNLFVNAWQAMPGGGNLFISAENVELSGEEVAGFGVEAGRFVKLTVTDTGIGMNEATRSRIFEPFFSTKERGRGTGLGLASVYGIIKNHGGFVGVESEEGIGTSFMIYLPASDKEAEDEPRGESRLHQGRGTVLFIDDEEMIVDVGAQMLEGLGYKVLKAGGGREGVNIFDHCPEKIDLVILDMIMPDLSGKETFKMLRHRDPSVKILLSSGYSLDSQAKELMNEGCKGFIQKPFTMAQLSGKIREIFEEDRERDFHVS